MNARFFSRHSIHVILLLIYLIIYPVMSSSRSADSAYSLAIGISLIPEANVESEAIHDAN